MQQSAQCTMQSSAISITPIALITRPTHTDVQDMLCVLAAMLIFVLLLWYCYRTYISYLHMGTRYALCQSISYYYMPLTHSYLHMTLAHALCQYIDQII